MFADYRVGTIRGGQPRSDISSLSDDAKPRYGT
jgi:hypothetical protein